MKATSSPFWLVLFFSAVALSAFAETVPKFPYPAGQERSFWRASDESATEIWLIARSDGLMELKGRDLSSTFEGLLLAGSEPGTYRCHGIGFRFVGGIGFTYLSSFAFKGGDTSILVETWTATLPNGETIEGKTVLHLSADEV